MSYGTFNKTVKNSKRALDLEAWADSDDGVLGPKSTVNETLFFYKWLFFGKMSRAQLKARLERYGLLGDDEGDVLGFFSDRRDDVTEEQIVEALKEQHEDARYFPVVERLIAALRNYAKYGGAYLHWNDLLSEYHCKVGESDCFTLTTTKDYVPEGHEYMIVEKMPPFAKRAQELELRPRVLSDASVSSLKVEEKSKAVAQALPKKGPAEVPWHLMRGGKGRKRTLKKRSRKAKGRRAASRRGARA
jgi:hypothetical protein